MKKGTLPKERFMTVMSHYTLDMHNHGALVQPAAIVRAPGKDYGCDPIGDGTFRMVPSGDIVGYEERCKRLAR